MFDNDPIAANDSDDSPGSPPRAHRAELKALHKAIVSLLTEADRLGLPFVSIHLDHADALCLAEIARGAGEP